MSLFQKANRMLAKLKLLLDGPSGSGKTHTALRIARGLGGKIAAIDTERHSIEKKKDELIDGVDVANLSDKRVSEYIKYILDAEANGYNVLIIDSLTHAWKELLEAVEKLAQAKYNGNTFRAWSEGTPMQMKLVDAILNADMHIIATSRVKTDWVVELNEKGRSVPKKVGLATEQGKGLEYEFDICMRMGDNNVGYILKDRFDMGLQGETFEKPGEDFGKKILNYLNSK